MKIFSILSEIWRGKDVYRLLMNEEAKKHTITGVVLDVGSGKTLASYHRFLNRSANTSVECLDLGFENGSSNGTHIDLEKDPLPFKDACADTVLLFNVLEHIYGNNNLLTEIKRVLKPGGKLIGVVPFLVGYHPDPHDYWRFTAESLISTFRTSGYSSIAVKSFGRGPAIAAWSQFEVVMPKVLKIIFLPLAFLLDKIIIAVRPKLNKNKFPLGLFFEITR